MNPRSSGYWMAAGRWFALCAAAGLAACKPSEVTVAAANFVLDSSGRHNIPTSGVFSMNQNGVTTAGKCDTVGVRYDSLHAVPDSLRRFLETNGYCNWDIAEYDDVQALRVGKTNYGPVAHSFASPWLANYVDVAPFGTANWINVAIVYVDPAGSTGSLPGEYKALHVAYGYNCVFLRHNVSASPATWSAIVLPVSSQGCGMTGSGPITTTTLDVLDEQKGGAVNDYPAVTRFIENDHGKTFLGVRCGDRWCMVGTKWPDSPKPVHEGKAGAKATARWEVKGWFDEQHLGVPNGGGKLQPAQLASVVPADNLGEITALQYGKGWNMVATVYLPDPPLGKYGDAPAGGGYRLQQGFTPVWLRNNPSPDRPDNWEAVFGDTLPGAGFHKHPVVRTDHSKYYVWPTARWRWVANDEQLWVACLQGCCMIKPDDLP